MNLKHGGESAIKRLKTDEPFTGLAAEAAAQVAEEIETQGIDAVMTRQAVRLQAVCDLFWNAIEKAAEDGDLETLDRYIKRFGWLSGVTLRSMVEIQKISKARKPQNIIDALGGGQE